MLPKNISFIQTSIFLKDTKTLILADLHLGAEESLIKQGILIPPSQKNSTIQRVKNLIKQTRPKQVILNGDIKHAFHTILQDEWQDIKELIQTIATRSELHIILGNHDNMLKPILDKYNIKYTNYIQIQGIFITHGDKLYDIPKNTQTIIIGHEHPSITLDDSIRKERYKCFIKAKYKKSNLIIMPSFYSNTIGSDALKENALGPYLKRATDKEYYILEDNKIYYFGNNPTTS